MQGLEDDHDHRAVIQSGEERERVDMSSENGEGHVHLVPPLDSVLDVEASASGNDAAAGKAAQTTKRSRVRGSFLNP